MVKFLINRPIAVIMTFLAFVLLGLVSVGTLPVSLLPDINIPEITVRVSYSNTSARELESQIVRPLRQQLMQVGQLENIESETRDGNATIRMRFYHGSNMDYIYIEVNEKLDAVAGTFPRDMERPKVIKASASDIPVFYLNLYPAKAVSQNDLSEFLEISQFADWVIRKRIEQLPEVAMVDVSGLLFPEVSIIPDQTKVAGIGITHERIRQVLDQNNVNLGSLMVRDGIYQYNVRFTSTLHSIEDIKNIMFSAGDRLYKLSDIATVSIRPRKPAGLYRWNNNPAVSMAVIKQSDARMNEMKEAMSRLTNLFEADYPEIRFELSQDQTGILDYTIGNLKNNLIYGGSLAILLMFLFLKDIRSPGLIALSVPTSLIISLLFFKLSGLSLNIISLSGLILGVGMMIDNSIIVIDNITQHIERGHKLHEACIRGTNEVIRPLLSSVLTTCAVFVPLIFLSGISGALFYDQAIAVASGLSASLVVSITLIPTLYYFIHLKTQRLTSGKKNLTFRIFKLENAYNAGFDFVFKYRRVCMILFLLLLPLAWFLLQQLPVQRMPPLDQIETVMKIDWNENLHLEENVKRVSFLINANEDLIAESGAFSGQQQFLLNNNIDNEITQAYLYLKSFNQSSLGRLVENLTLQTANYYPYARVSFDAPLNIFDQIFETQEPPLVAKIGSERGDITPGIEQINAINTLIENTFSNVVINPLPIGENLVLTVIPDNLLLYRVDQNFLYSQLRMSLDQYDIGRLSSDQTMIPIVLGEQERIIGDILRTARIRNTSGVEIPLSSLVTMHHETGYSLITSGKEGEYLPIIFSETGRRPGDLTNGIKAIVDDQRDLNVTFGGSWYETLGLLKEMMIVILISLLLLYFILAAQFESLMQPIIVMLEIPLNLAGVFFALYLAGAGINIMSLIGIVVMAGIVINDSILKIDTINHLRAEGMNLIDALHTGGTRRLKPIVMTSLTTILALTPTLLSSDMGSELQAPLALAVIGGMTMGTFVSLYFIPLMYYYLYK